MHQESHPILFSGGVHDGSIAPLAPLGQKGLRLGGLDPSDYDQWDAIRQMHPPGGTVQLSAETGDPQLDRDLVAIGRHTIWNGTNLWPGQTIPDHAYNMAANALRVAEGSPQEGQQQVPIDRIRPAPYLQQRAAASHDKSNASAQVSVEMDSRVSKWSVIALGELQQPSAVGADQDYNPVVDGPNPNGPDFSDNAQNSHEQEVALQTWVNMAVDLLDRGETADAVLAQLSHDGCPDPQAVLQRAQAQPQAAPISDSIGQDPFDVPAKQGETGEMQSVSQQPPVVTGKVRVRGSSIVGREVERYEDQWGQGIVRVALDEGGFMNVAPEAVEPIEAESHSPVSEVQAFIDSFEPVAPHRASILARIANLKEAKLYAMRALKTSSISDQVELDRIALAADEEVLALRQWLRSDESMPDLPVVFQPYSHNALNLAPSIPDREYEGNVHEAAAIWAHESPYTEETAHFAVESAVLHARSLNMTPEQVNEFITVASERIGSKKPEVAVKVAATTIDDHDGPVEALFL